MGLPLADDVGVNVKAAVLSLLHALHRDGDTVRHFVPEQAQGLLPNQLAGELPHGLLGHRILTVEEGALRQIAIDCVEQEVYVLAL